MGDYTYTWFMRTPRRHGALASQTAAATHASGQLQAPDAAETLKASPERNRAQSEGN